MFVQACCIVEPVAVSAFGSRPRRVDPLRHAGRFPHRLPCRSFAQGDAMPRGVLHGAAVEPTATVQSIAPAVPCPLRGSLGSAEVRCMLSGGCGAVHRFGAGGATKTLTYRLHLSLLSLLLLLLSLPPGHDSDAVATTLPHLPSELRLD